MKEILSILKPDDPLPLIFDSPHSGRAYPDDFNHTCSPDDLHKTEDRFVDHLFQDVPSHGAAFLHAHFPRCYIDANRAADDIDPRLLSQEWPDEQINPTARSDAGIGLIWRLIKPGQTIYDAPLNPNEIQARLERYYHPYHTALDELISAAHYNFGQVWHINCHSMPKTSAYPKRPIALAGQEVRHADFCLGNLDGTSCSLEFTREIRGFLQDLGYLVTINDPFKGVEIVDRHCDPLRGRHSLQLEVNRALYLDEKTGEKNSNYNALKSDIDKLVAFIASYVQNNLTALAAD